MKKYRKILVIIFLIIILIYICNITLLPNGIILKQGETLNLKTVFGITIEENNKIIQASNNINKNKVNYTEKMEVSLNLFGKIPVKQIDIDVVPNTTVIPIGKAIGMKLYTEGVLVVGMSEINGEKPYENSGIQEGDSIVEINNEQIENTEDLIKTVNKSNGKSVEIKYKRNEQVITTSIEPVKVSDSEYKLGLWVRDAMAGVGTLTFYDKSSNMFAALGHGITDIDTSEIVTIANGELTTTNILSIVKGKKGMPGEIRGTIENARSLGKICKNTNFGVYGEIKNIDLLNQNNMQEMNVAMRKEIQTGEAKILCELENGKVEEYNVEIKKIYLNNNENNKSMVVKITDERLIEKTGGIIQGMSGAPIIQNGKFIGAITHVLVNEPTVGYGVFADIMVKKLKEVE